MPLIPITAITRPEEVVELIAEMLKSSSLDLAYVAKYDEPLLPEYPAVLVMSAPLQKEVHGTHTWLLTLRAEIYVMHARLTESRATRNYEDLVLATDIVNLLESDMTLGNRIIHGWVETEVPGAMPPRNNKANAVVSTRLGWSGVNEARF